MKIHKRKFWILDGEPYPMPWETSIMIDGEDDDDGGGGGDTDDDDTDDDDGSPDSPDPGKDSKGKQRRQARRDGLMGVDTDDDDTGDDDDDDQDGDDDDDGKKAKRPDNIPKKFWDPEKGEAKLDELAKAYKTLEKAHTKLKNEKSGEPAPDDAADYLKGDEADDFLKDVAENAANVGLADGFEDPGLQAWAKVAHRHGIPKSTMLNIARDVMVEMNDVIDPPIDPEQEREALGKNATAMIREAQNWADGLFDRGVITERQADLLYQVGATAEGVKLFRAIRKDMGQQIVVPLDTPETGDMSATEWHRAYRKAVADNNYAEQERLDKIGEELFGNDPAGAPTVQINPDN